jgi:hypothetical protein
VQSEAVLFVFYAVLVPFAAARQILPGPRRAQPSGWRARAQADVSVAAARRQF